MADAGANVRLIQFARAPQAGQVKTRMIPYLSGQQACELHRQLVRWTCQRLLEAQLGEVELSVAGDTSDALFAECLSMGVASVSQQRGADLGERMYRAIRGGLQTSERVVLVGSDCPGIDREYLDAALKALDRVPLVIGPAEDGGYVLIGATVIYRELFEGITWGSHEVLAQTLSAVQRQGLGWVELPALVDIDRPADLPTWRALQGKGVALPHAG